MRMTTMIMLIATLSVSAKGVSQNVTFSGRDVSLEKVFDEIKKQTGLKILYTEDVFTTAKPITVDAVNLPVERFLQLALKNQTVKFIVENKTIFISKKEDATPRGHLSTPLISPSLTVPPIS
jgi:TonB-dependent starch-binding outer membrane protein SusC